MRCIRSPYARDVSYTAASYLHRFYMRRSMRDYKPKVRLLAKYDESG